MKKEKLVSLKDVQTRLTLPGGSPVSRNSLYMYLEKLSIQTSLQKIGGKGWAIAHVTADQAAQIEAEFRRTHWRKFKAQEQK